MTHIAWPFNKGAYSSREHQKGRKSLTKLNWKYDKCATKDFHLLSQRILPAMLQWKVIFLTLYSQSTSVPLPDTCKSLHPLTRLWLCPGITRSGRVLAVLFRPRPWSTRPFLGSLTSLSLFWRKSFKQAREFGPIRNVVALSVTIPINIGTKL